VWWRVLWGVDLVGRGFGQLAFDRTERRFGEAL
jgi:hypothetical protein